MKSVDWCGLGNENSAVIVAEVGVRSALGMYQVVEAPLSVAVDLAGRRSGLVGKAGQPSQKENL